MIITWRYWTHPEWLLHAPVYVSGTRGPISCLPDQMKELVSAGVKLTPCPSPIFSPMIPPRCPPPSSKHPSQPWRPPPPLPSRLHRHLLSPQPDKVERVDNVACAYTVLKLICEGSRLQNQGQSLLLPGQDGPFRQIAVLLGNRKTNRKTKTTLCGSVNVSNLMSISCERQLIIGRLKDKTPKTLRLCLLNIKSLTGRSFLIND